MSQTIFPTLCLRINKAKQLYTNHTFLIMSRYTVKKIANLLDFLDSSWINHGKVHGSTWVAFRLASKFHSLERTLSCSQPLYFFNESVIAVEIFIQNVGSRNRVNLLWLMQISPKDNSLWNCLFCTFTAGGFYCKSG